MRPCFPLKGRIWACLLYHTEPYKTERATTMFRGNKVSLRPANIAAKLYEVAIDYYEQSGRELTDEEKKAERIDRANIRRVLAELEDEGFCERRTSDGALVRDLDPETAKALGNKVEIIVFARPRPAIDPRKCKQTRGGKLTAFSIFATTIGVPKPQLWILRRFMKVVLRDYLAPEVRSQKLTTLLSSPDGKVVIQDYFAREVKEAFDAYLEAEKVATEEARKRLKGVLERTPPEITSEMKPFEISQPSASAAIAASVIAEEHAPATAPGPPPPRGGEKASTPDGEPDMAIAAVESDQFSLVAKKLAKYDRALTGKQVREFLALVEEARPGIDVETLLKVIEHQAKTIGPGIRSAYHYLRSKVPEFLRDDDLFFAWYKDQDAEPLRHAPPRPRSHQGEVDDLRKGMMEYAREIQRRRDCARDSAPNAIEALDKHPDTQDVQQQPQLARSAGG